jgi:predicted O-methyltransferase YrrM
MSGVTEQRDANFEDAWASVANVQGWMTRDQAQRLWERASELRLGSRIVEIGSFHGRSLIVLATAAPNGVELIAIDPHGGNDRGPQEIDGFQEQAEDDHQRFNANLASAGVADRINHLRMFSHDALAQCAGAVDLLYVDGAHRFKPARADIVEWGAKVRVGGIMLVHDSFSSIGVTAALFSSNFVGRYWRYDGRSQSMAQFTRVSLAPLARLANLARGLAQLPYFVRNVTIKVLIFCKLGRVSRLLGGDGTWPY